LIQMIKQRILTKLGRSIIGPILPRLALSSTSKIRESEQGKVRVECFSCSAIVGIKSKEIMIN
jgi:hypothetical protein